MARLSQVRRNARKGTQHTHTHNVVVVVAARYVLLPHESVFDADEFPCQPRHQREERKKERSLLGTKELVPSEISLRIAGAREWSLIG